MAMKLGGSCESIAWIDLSFNCVKGIGDALTSFPNLTTLYLHANYISLISDVEKLASLRKLRTLTLHGNPVENVKGYRQHVIGGIPTLKHLDFCAITKQDRLTSRMVNSFSAKKRTVRPTE
ncbi:Leucine-rich repeat-containing protein 51 [Irineochytrium annulatum]|nr:Leucine-rich repeat-containing protein 51 [Irineochytrium annulatum]